MLGEFSAAAKAKAEAFVQEGDWFQRAQIALKTGGLETRLRNEYTKSAYNKAFEKVTDDVAAAKRELYADIKYDELEMGDEWDKFLKGDVSEPVRNTVDSELTQFVQDSRTAVRKTKKAVEEDLTVIEQDS